MLTAILITMAGLGQTCNGVTIPMQCASLNAAYCAGLIFTGMCLGEGADSPDDVDVMYIYLLTDESTGASMLIGSNDFGEYPNGQRVAGMRKYGTFIPGSVDGKDSISGGMVPLPNTPRWLLPKATYHFEATNYHER